MKAVRPQLGFGHLLSGPRQCPSIMKLARICICVWDSHVFVFVFVPVYGIVQSAKLPGDPLAWWAAGQNSCAFSIIIIKIDDDDNHHYDDDDYHEPLWWWWWWYCIIDNYVVIIITFGCSHNLGAVELPRSASCNLIFLKLISYGFSFGHG